MEAEQIASVSKRLSNISIEKCFKIDVFSLCWQISPQNGPNSKICTRFQDATKDRLVNCQQIFQLQPLVHIADSYFVWNISLEVASVLKLITRDES